MKGTLLQLVTMESNRDEALKCLRLAEKYLDEANEVKAARFAQKSMNMFPNEKAKGESTSLFTYFENSSVPGMGKFLK